MTIDRISTTKMRITLSGEEVSSLFGGYEKIDYRDPGARCALNAILNKAIPHGQFPLDSSRLLIEVRPDGRGCSIYLTKLQKRFRRLRRSKAGYTYCAVFPDGGTMFDGIAQFVGKKKAYPKSDLYKTPRGYELLFGRNGMTGKELVLLREYCTELYASEHIGAVASEYGTLIRADDAFGAIADAIDVITPPAT